MPVCYFCSMFLGVIEILCFGYFVISDQHVFIRGNLCNKSISKTHQ